MSIWTYAHGQLEMWCKKDEIETIARSFGQSLDYDDPVSRWVEAEQNPQRFMPFGSEGSIKLEVNTNPFPNSKDEWKCFFKFSGGLRNYTNELKIIKWFSNAVTQIAQENHAVKASISVECSDRVTWSLDVKPLYIDSEVM